MWLHEDYMYNPRECAASRLETWRAAITVEGILGKNFTVATPDVIQDEESKEKKTVSILSYFCSFHL
jgi:hypothetical protein